MTVLVEDEAGDVVRAVWFNQPYRADDLRPGRRVVLSGKTSLYEGALQMNSPEYEIVGPAGPRRLIEGIVPVYPATEGLYQWQIRRAVRAALEPVADRVRVAFIYGSFARGEETPESDIDLFIIVPSKEKYDEAIEMLSEAGE